jgi:hypothetical protein
VTKSGNLHFEFDTGRQPEEVAFSIEEPSLLLLRSYLAEAQVLEELVLGFKQPTVGFSMSATTGGSATFTTREPDAVQRAALLHHLRPFLLDEEPYSFFKTRNIVARACAGDFISGRLLELKRMFGGQRLQEQMTVLSGDVLVNSEATLKRWLNAFQYHRDREKADAFEKSMGALPPGVTRLILTMLLFQKSDAVRYLGHIIFKLVAACDKPEALNGPSDR